jgi:hypothetical protein
VAKHKCNKALSSTKATDLRDLGTVVCKWGNLMKETAKKVEKESEGLMD